MKYAKTLKENLHLVKESWMPDSETISWLKDYLRDVKKGEGYVDIDKVVYDADIELNKDFSKNKKDLADYIKRIGGASLLKESFEVVDSGNGKKYYSSDEESDATTWAKDNVNKLHRPLKVVSGYKMYKKFEPRTIVKEATSNLREGFGELEVYTSFGPGIGVQIYPSRNGELTAHVGYVGSSSGNSTLKKELKTDTELKAIDEIKIADLKQIEKVVKKHLDALDSDLQRLFKQYGYK